MKSKLNFKATHEDGKVFDMYDFGLWVESFHILSPNPKRTTQDQTGVDGERLKKSKLGTRLVNISFMIEADTLKDFDDLKHLIYYIFYSEKPLEIIRDLKPNERIYAVQDIDFDISNITSSDGQFNLTLKMYEPFIFGVENTLAVTTSFGTFTIEGHRKTPWTSATTFTASAAQYTIENNEGGKVILDYNFIAGDVLEIDYKKRKITLNGASLATALTFASHWFVLKPNLNSLKASHATNLTYTERWL